LNIAAFASEQNTADPVDKAIVAAASVKTFPGRLIREYPLSSDCMMIAKVYVDSLGSVQLAAKGAPEEIFQRSRTSPEMQHQFESVLKQMTDGGMRVIAVARGNPQIDSLPDDKRQLHLEFLGLIGLADPIRPTVPGAMAELASAGVRVVMITGDYAGTASSIAKQAGIVDSSQVITGDAVEGMEGTDLHTAVGRCNVFARVRPVQKLRLIEALKANGEVVAMTGDGVNDAPALKAAHIGIAMGARGSDVAREAAALVLSDDDFPAIVDAVRLGRRIYDNLTKAIRYIFAVHVPIAGLAVLPVVFNWPILLMPLHIVFFELVVDPACSIAFEAEPAEPGIMLRKPRSEKVRLFDRSTVGMGLLQGAGLFVAVSVAFLLAMRSGHASEEARAIAFTALIAGNLSLIWANHSSVRTILETGRSPNIALWMVTAGAVATLLTVLYVPSIRELFAFSALHLTDFLVAFLLGTVSITWFEVLKLVHRRSSATVTRPNFKRIAFTATGWVFLLAGIAGLVLPFLQGILFLFIGLLILSKEYRWAAALVTHLESRFPRASAWLAKARKREINTPGGRMGNRIS